MLDADRRPEALAGLVDDGRDLGLGERRIGRVLDRAELAGVGLASGRAEKGRDPAVLGVGHGGDQRVQAHRDAVRTGTVILRTPAAMIATRSPSASGAASFAQASLTA